jgi:hypothetical protein
MKFTEGEEYEFSVLKKVDLPEEGEFFLLRHSTGRRLMLPVLPYKNYGIEPDQTIVCRVDKVNCTGKVYLEPKHPFYLEGLEYQFNILNIENNTESINELKLTVSDIFENRIELLWPTEFPISPKNYVSLKVDRIKKGIPVLFPSLLLSNDSKIDELIGKRVNFTINKEIKNLENEDVFVLETDNGYKAELKKRYYKYYDLSIGNTVECHIYGKNHLGHLKVEPKNPYYTIGELYEFDIESIEEYNEDDFSLVLIDIFGQKCGVHLNKNEKKTLKNNTRALCRVIGFRKGRPKLELKG